MRRCELGNMSSTGKGMSRNKKADGPEGEGRVWKVEAKCETLVITGKYPKSPVPLVSPLEKNVRRASFEVGRKKKKEKDHDPPL